MKPHAAEMPLRVALPPAHAQVAALLGTKLEGLTVLECEAVAKLLRQMETLFQEIRAIVNA